MKILSSTLVFLSMVANIHSNSVQDPRQLKKIAQRREVVTYSNSIVHENPTYPDQSAQSSVKVNFNPNQVEPQKYVYGGNPYQKNEFPHTHRDNYYPTNAPQTQLFNVGYSVRFTNDNNKPVKPQIPKYSRTNSLDAGEIITGTRKLNEEVQVPSVNMSPEEYVTAALINSKKQKISGIKAKPQLFTSYPNPKYLLSQANLSPTTQKYYQTLEQLKPQLQNTQELQQKYSWRSLGPGVEIIKSTEVPTSHKYTRSETPVHFNHAKALGRSQDFDYSNAVDNSNFPTQNGLYYNNLQKSQTTQVQIPVAGAQNVANLPLDTTLLKEQIPIQVDTRLVEEAMRNQGSLYSNTKYSQNQDLNYSQQGYRTIPVQESTQNKQLQVFYQPEQLKGFQDYQPDQNRFQLKVYGRPQPLPISSYNDGSSEEEIRRQPRYLNNLNTNLRPPPFNVQYQRLIHVG